MSCVTITVQVDESGTIIINGTPIASINYVDSEIQKIEKVNSVQQSVFQSFNGLILTGMFPNSLNGVYVQLVQSRRAVATTNSIRFFDDNTHYMYLRQIDSFYYILVYLESATSTILGGLTLVEPAWVIWRYNVNPEQISSNIDHIALLSNQAPVQFIVSFKTKRFGSQSFPDDARVEFF
jgi:hypothetical protein